ncbi:MAG: HAMP domain-containing histidine kinase [Bacteroidetes bacterium]|nr:HAMP domain-containing histidine kinase [Bacteroidota bacterium]MBU1114822.1 HAMP domain-containing histidine kinase [Bacteroidota bacterium]MBU1799969.1 HAMP domain-containing histidine kinase [Bacteroidota bacterium]
MNRKMTGGPGSIQIKVILLVFATIIALATFIYTQTLISQLEAREKKVAELFASSLQQVAELDASDKDFTFLLDVIKRIDFPLILADSSDNVSLNGMTGGIRNLDIDSTLTDTQKVAFIKDKIAEFSEINNPIFVYIQDSIVLSKIYFGDSVLITQLRYYPYLQIIFAMMFVIIAYFSFSYLKKNEQSNIWVGMAKETAHQLGTPISSLLGWNEILKINKQNPDKVEDITLEMSNDLQRLNKIADRFSKIGSIPKLVPANITEVIQSVIEYFNRRLPISSKKTELKIINATNILIPLNRSLFEWVIENLIKNALDAIESKNGLITFEIIEEANNVIIDVSDNGKGIDLKNRKDVFRPGYSTKKRGWGLGLSLVKRIVEDYHKGKIYVKSSVIDEGTIFQIILKKS